MRSSVSVRWSLAARHCQRLFSKYLPPAAANPKNRLIIGTPHREQSFSDPAGKYQFFMGQQCYRTPLRQLSFGRLKQRATHPPGP